MQHFWLVALFVIIIVAVAISGEKEPNTLTVNEFEKAYREQKLKSMEISEDRMIVTGELKTIESIRQ